MLEQVGLNVDRQIVDVEAHNRRIFVSPQGQSAEQQTWDIALALHSDNITFPVTELYQYSALGGPYDWIGETPELQRLADQVARAVDREKQRRLIQQMERLNEQAYFLFLYTPIKLYAVNSGHLNLHETYVTDHNYVPELRLALIIYPCY